MTMLYQGIYEHLRLNGFTAPLLAVEPPGLNRIYNSVIPQKIPNTANYMPAVVFNLRGVERPRSYCGTDSFVHTNVVLDCYGVTYESSQELSQAIRRALIDYSGLLGGIVHVRDAALQTEFDVVDVEPGLFRVSQSWFIWHEE